MALSLVFNIYSVRVTRLGAMRVPDLLLGAWQDLSGSDCLYLSPMEAVCQRTGLGKQGWSSFTPPLLIPYLLGTEFVAVGSLGFQDPTSPGFSSTPLVPCIYRGSQVLFLGPLISARTPSEILSRLMVLDTAYMQAPPTPSPSRPLSYLTSDAVSPFGCSTYISKQIPDLSPAVPSLIFLWSFPS